VVAAALAKARDANASQSVPQGPGTIDQVPPPPLNVLRLGALDNSAGAPTGLKYAPPPDDNTSSPALRIETASAGFQVVSPEFSEAVGVTMTAAAAVLVVGRPTVAVTDSNLNDLQKPQSITDSINTVASAAATGIVLNVGEVGAGLIGIQVPQADPGSIGGGIPGVTMTAEVVDRTAGVIGVATTGAGLRGRATLRGGIGAIFEAPLGDGEIGAKVKGDLVVESGDVRAGAARFGGDVAIDGKLRVNGEDIRPVRPPITGTGVFKRRTAEAIIAHDALSPDAFVQVVLLGPPRPRGLSISHIDRFQGGCSVHLTGRTLQALPFSWIAFVP
jgi:hypothetical protein